MSRRLYCLSPEPRSVSGRGDIGGRSSTTNRGISGGRGSSLLALFVLHVFVKKRDGAAHGGGEGLREVVIVPRIGVGLRFFAGGFHLLLERLGECQRHRFIRRAVVKLERAGDVGKVRVRRKRLPERRILLGRAVAFLKLLPPPARAGGNGRRYRRRPPAPVVDEGGGGAAHASPDDARLDICARNHGAERYVAAHGVTPHADARRIRAGVFLYGGDGVQSIDGVGVRAVA